MEHNPYAPTKAALNERLAVDDDTGSVDGKRLASRGRRITNLTIDDTSRAHLEECRHRINKVLEANLDVREP